MYYFECYRCGHVREVSHQKYKYFPGQSCEKCGGEFLEVAKS